MSKISKVFYQVFRPLSEQQANGEEFEMGSMRKQFIHNVTTTDDKEIKLTKNGAASYFQMCRKRASGEDMYDAHKKWNKKQTKAETAPEEQPTVEEQVQPEVNVDMSNRWLVGNKQDKAVFESFTTRSAAQKRNKELVNQGIESNWIDGDKINKDEYKPVAIGQ